MDKAKKKTIKNIICLSLVAILVLGLALMPLLAKQEAKEDGPVASILSGEAEIGSLEEKVIGGGALAEEDAISIEIPESVKLKEFLVTNGQGVKKGDAIATVDRVTVMSAITEIQQTLDLLADEIDEESKKDTDGKVVALAGGTVKLLYATAGASVQSVMLEHGALAVLSLDGLMAADLTVESDLSAGSLVKVTRENGSVIDGKVASNLAGEMTVTVEDAGYGVGEAVTIATEDGTLLGNGSLYIYSPWSASAYTGTVSSVKISEGETVKAGKTIFTLKDMGNSAKYQQLISQRQTYEELMFELFQAYQSKQLSAPADGVVSGIDANSAQLLSATVHRNVTLLAGSPNGDNETLFQNYVGKISAKGENGWALQIDPANLSVSDYKALPENLVENASMTDVVIYDPNPDEGAIVPVYELSEGEWKSVEPDAINEGDILLLALSENGQLVWMVRIEKAKEAEKDAPENGTNPPPATETPSDPDASQTPEAPVGGTENKPNDGGSTTLPDSVVPGNSALSGNSFPSGGNFGGNFNGSFPQEEAVPEIELFDATLTQVAAVTPQETMSLEITVDELDVSSLETGMTAQIKINALGGEKVTATVTEIGSVGTSNGGSSKFTVKFSMPRGENMLVGMSATASIVYESISDTVLLPAKALVEKGTKTYVYTDYDEKKEVLCSPVEVETGASDGENVQILEGLKGGETYYYAYYDTLTISYTPDFNSGGNFRPGR